jgi:Zn-dependent protease with chaperone function
VVLMLLGLLAFVALYVGMGVALGELLLGLWGIEVSGRHGFYLMVGGTVALAVPIVFLVKGLFYKSRSHREGMVEVTREEQPVLFRFIDRLVAETGAPAPRHVYVSPAVDAAVFYEPSLLSLVWPTPKSLVIGLGLVNHLTMSELKAVLGHELGHFSQRSMKLGSYVYVASEVVGNLVHGRDAFDDLLEQGKRSDVRIAIVAYVVSGVVGTMRLVLRVAFEVLALGHRSLGREMEMAADRVAVSVAGSDAIARGLYKAEVADACYGATLARLTHAADQGLVTDDFYVHQERALGDLRLRLDRPSFGDVTARTDGHLFEADTASKPSMWATHPPSADRERAARSHAVEADHDERSAWLLFPDAPALRQRLTTELVRRQIPHAKSFARAAAKIEAVFDEERAAERRAHEHGEMYRGRPLAKLDLPAIFGRTPRPDDALSAAHAALYGDRVAELSREHRRLATELGLLQRAARGELRADALKLEGRPVPLREAPDRIAAHLSALEGVDRRFEAIDVEVAQVHAEMAIALGEVHARRLRRRYTEEARLMRWLRFVRDAQGGAMAALQPVMKGDKSEAAGLQLIDRLGALDDAVAQVLRQARDVKPPRLPNVKRDGTMASFLLDRRTAGPYQNDVPVGPWMQEVMAEAGEVLDKLGRLHQRAIASLLAAHEAIHTAWVSRRDGGEVAAETDEGAEDGADDPATPQPAS